jgi:hypothetical protein
MSKKDDGECGSIVGKMLHHLAVFGASVESLNFVSNADFNFSKKPSPIKLLLKP